MGRLFYLALKPTLFGPAIEGLEQAGLLSCDRGDAVAWRRVVVEKPFGKDLASSLRHNDAPHDFFRVLLAEQASESGNNTAHAHDRKNDDE